MSDAADLNNDDHWARLASELGLEAEPPRPAPPKSRPTPEADPPAPVEQFAAVEPPGEFDEEVAVPSPRGRRRRPPADREAEDAAPTPPAEPSLLDDEPPRARQRRGRRPASDAPAETSGGDEEAGAAVEGDENAPADEAQGDPQAEDKKRRRRRRSRRKKGPETAAVAGDPTEEVEDTAVEERAPEPEPLDEDAAPEIISDWNVPSWNDLIASLHRPDR